MFIKKISIKKFRGFQDVAFKLGHYLTVLAGQNGTQKTTLLGMLSQPFSITDKSNPCFGEKPLCGGNFKSAFAEKFKLSEIFDKPKHHEWTLNLNRVIDPDFTIESIKRESSSDAIRFWKKGDRAKGSGYIQMPVIYLSLLRLLPLGEDHNIGLSTEVLLTNSEFEFYQKWHNKILIIPDVLIENVQYLESKQKNTMGVSTSFYDWKMNSAGQDNLGKILLAILSFKRLQEKHNDDYKGGILAIDELDATLYPASQIKLLEALRKFASTYKIQIIFTTHSLTILEKACALQSDQHVQEQIKVVYLEKVDRQVTAIEELMYETIKRKLNVSLDPSKKITKIPVFTEDKEGRIFLKALLKTKGSHLQCLECSLGCDNLIELSRKRILGFKFPDSLIVLDGDVKENNAQNKKVNALFNILLLPGSNSPERLLAIFLHAKSDKSPLWSNIQTGYTKQFCFQDYSFEEIKQNRKKAKEWFQSQSEHWGRNCVRLINFWIKENKNDVDAFIECFDKMQSKFIKALSMNLDT